MSLKCGVLDETNAGYNLPPLKDQEFNMDDKFAHKVIKILRVNALLPRKDNISNLCTKCSVRNFWEDCFRIDESASLEGRASVCNLATCYTAYMHGPENPKQTR